MTEKFFADMTADDKKKMAEMMPKMMESMIGGMSKEEKQKMMDKMMGGGKSESAIMEMMPKMMEGCEEGEMPMMPQMMAEMMPKCLKMMLPKIPKEKRIDFILEIVVIMMEQGRVGMSEEEKKDFAAKVIEKVKT